MLMNAAGKPAETEVPLRIEAGFSFVGLVKYRYF